MTRHRAVDARGDPYEIQGFDHDVHDRWVAEGFCPVVSVSKAYCGKRPGHGGKHGSAVMRICEPPGTSDTIWVEWER
jgi:hypothetical protein